MLWACYKACCRQIKQAQPNTGHQALRALTGLPSIESLHIVTQNVDDLHERAGSTQVQHLHGSLFAPRCFDCGLPFLALAEANEPSALLPPPRCMHCGGTMRPGVLWFGEALPEGPWQAAIDCVAQADLVYGGGHSGRVYPAASLPDIARAARAWRS